MRQRAYHRIQWPDGRTEEGPVVVVTASDGHFLEHYPLCGEQAQTEWVGGTYRIENN